MVNVNRRLFLGGLGAGAIAGVVGCNSSNGGGQSGTSIRYGHWDNGSAQAIYASLFDEFMEENPEISVVQEFAGFDDFQERMTTHISSGNVADIFWIAAPQVITYHQNGLYRDLEDLPNFDFSEYDDRTLESIRIEGELNTIPMGMSIPCFRYNEEYLEESNMDLPEEWTWDNLAEFLIEYSNSSNDDRKGIFYSANHDLCLEAWLRQHGESLWTEDGRLGASVEALSEWINWWEDLRNAGATLTLDEQGGVSGSWNELGERALFFVGNQNHILEAAEVFPDFTLSNRSVPELGAAEDGWEFAYNVRLSVYSETPDEKMDAIGKLLDFNLNSREWMEALGPVMGAPVSQSQLDAARNSDDHEVQQVMKVTDETLEADMRPRFDAPAGSSTWRLEFDRAIEDVVLGEKNVTESMTDFRSAVESQIG